MASYYYILRAALLINLILLINPVRAARNLSQAQYQRPPRLRIKLDLARLDIPPAGKFSYAHLQHALHRTSLRLSHFHYMLQLHAGRSLSSSSSTPVFADSSNSAFLTTLSIGTPPVSFNAIVDTGSDLLWLQCEPCSPCFTNSGLNTIFDPSLSSTYSVLPCSNPFCSYLQNSCGTGTGTSSASCSYNTSYGDSSFTAGDLSVDTLTLPDPSGAAQLVESLTFGCGHDNKFTSSVGEADGIVGLGLGRLSLPSQLSISILSYCLQTITDPASKTTSLYLGEVAQLPPSSNGPTLMTQFFTNPFIAVTYYYVQLNGISVGGQLVTATSNGAFEIQSDGTGGVIFDSGTTITSLKSDAYNAVVDAFTSSIAIPPTSTSPTSGLCYELSSASNIQFPSLTFHFEGADLQLPQDNYFMAYEADNLICLTLGPSNQIVSIFGNMQQQNFFITYDLQALTLSLTPTTCDS